MQFNQDGVPIAPHFRSTENFTDLTASPAGRVFRIRWRAEGDLRYEIRAADAVVLVASTMQEALQWVARQ